MGANLRSQRQKIRQRWVAIIVTIAIAVVAVVLVIVGYWFDWAGFNGYIQVSTIHTLSGPTAGTVTRTEAYQPGKTLWDWLQLLIIPLALAIIALLFNRSERKNEQRVASDNQQETALQEYIKEMSELLLHGKLRESEPGDEVRTIARVRTLTVLLRLNKERKGTVLQFLYESGLIAKDRSLVDLSGANFSKVDLFDAAIHEADLSRTILIEANLSGGVLQGTNFERANLTRAVLSLSRSNKADLRASTPDVSLSNKIGRAYMRGVRKGMVSASSKYFLLGVNLSDATLTEADLRGLHLTQVNLHGSVLLKAKLQRANLSGANLSEAMLIETELQHADLSGANLSEATLFGAQLQMTKLIKANLCKAGLVEANLRGADLTMADLSGADLTLANLERAIVTAEQLDKAKSLKGATMPDGNINQ